MPGRALHAELQAVRALVADELAGISASGDDGRLWIRSACARLTALDAVLVETAGVVSAPARLVAATAATFLVVAGSAALAGAAGLGAAGVLAVCALALLAALAAGPWTTRRAATILGRRRLARAARPRLTDTHPAVAPLPQPPPPTATTSPPGHPPAAVRTAAELPEPAAGSRHQPPPEPAARTLPPHPAETEVGRVGAGVTGLVAAVDGLSRARVRLVSAALRHAGPDDWTTPLLRRAIRTDPVIRRLAHADQLLCQAVDCIERHLGDLRKDTSR